MSASKIDLSQRLYRLYRFTRVIWVRSALIGSLAIVAAAGSGVLAPLVPDAIASAIKADQVEKILEILASGMLAVTIFSLSVMVTVRLSASSQATPRSHQLLVEDTTTQNVLATFLGAFLFSLVGVITLGTGVYSGDAATVILMFTLLVIALMVVEILRWISHLSDLGSVIATTRAVQDAARGALAVWLETPCMGGTPMHGPPRGTALASTRSGYVQNVDMQHLSDLAEEHGFELFLDATPGRFIAEGQPLAHHTGAPDMQELRAAFTVGDRRRFDQDPRFGLIVLTEIAQRALSSGINDPGTAIDVLTRQHALLALFRDRIKTGGTAPRHPRIHVKPLSPDVLMQDAFDPIARDGVAMVEVQIRLQKVLADLGRGGSDAFSQAARATSARALERAGAGITLAADRQRLLDTVARLND